MTLDSTLSSENEPTPSEDKKHVLLSGNVGVGKTTLFERLCPPSFQKRPLRFPGTHVDVSVGTIPRGKLGSQSEVMEVYDCPGIHNIFTRNEDERVLSLILLEGRADMVLEVMDAKNLRRSLILALQIAEFGLPLACLLNMTDEAENRGIEISCSLLGARLGAEARPISLKEEDGKEVVSDLVAGAKTTDTRVAFPVEVEEALKQMEPLLRGTHVPARAISILLLAGSKDGRIYTERYFGKGVLDRIDKLMAPLSKELNLPLDVILTQSYAAQAEKIVAEVQRVHRRSPPFLVRFGRWAQRPATGVPIALTVLALMYLWVGMFGANYLTDLINDRLFVRWVIPWFKAAVSPIPVEFIRAALVDEHFGMLTTGIFLAFGIVLPVLFCFYLFFGLLEESSYLTRFSVLLNRMLRFIGLSGKGVIPLVMGFSCVTMAILTTRTLDTRKEKIIANFLLLLGVPCAPLLAVMMVILGKMPWYATVFVFGYIVLQTAVAGYLADRILPGARADFIMELPPMRIPGFRSVLRKTWRRTWMFLKEVVPLFLLASFVIFVFDRVGGLRMLERITRPLMSGLLGLPDQAVRVFMKTVIRREAGATELDLLKSHFTNLQLIVTMLVMTFLIPCINAIMVMLKERGLKTTMIILGTVFVYALLAGGFVNHMCRLMGISFS